ncbi:MAG: T9SS type A sorting domain-containing protein [Candidatus Cloacimonadaceae bacterium]|nr:T9SS type A sorting domain-containing protein [Candidatus Cloacimonadaceae bacterium]
MPKWAKYLHLVGIIALCSTLFGMVPPHPRYKGIVENWQAPQMDLPDNFGIDRENGWFSTVNTKHLEALSPKNGDIPQNILVLMVEFSDVHFRLEPAYPDSLAHDLAFFDRWLLHLSDFFWDASHGQYEMSYHIHPQRLRLPNPLSYYGADSATKTDVNLPYILPHLMPLCSDEINFGDYDGVIVFHAGAGQETDIEKKRTNTIWSTFITRRLLQSVFDPENDDYPGFETPDGSILKNIVIVPEDEFHDYFPGPQEDENATYVFSLYGVLAHQFAHILGLPSLFDGNISNGASQGIGHWGLMGTGIWNASGYVPAQLSAWCRYYLGWENAVEVWHDAENLSLDHFLNHNSSAQRLYKVNISYTEYFLIENRQQNPDGSTSINGLPSFSFKLLPDGEQDYYPPDSLGNADPFFNFSENRFSGCEWDFFLPGYGNSPFTDGSGILIWHIDENVIAAKFSPNFDINRINEDAHHKGVDLEEADGYQNLDTAVVSEYKYGGPYDSFRANNNEYFGKGFHNELLWLPTAESYYGGIPLEIYDISESGNTMSFSVRFAWRLDAGFEGENHIPPAVIDFNGDGEDEILYPMPDGKIALFSQDEMSDGFPRYLQGYPIHLQGISHPYTWDGNDLYMPLHLTTLASLAKLNNTGTTYPLRLLNHRWISHPVDAGNKLFLPLRSETEGFDKVLVYDKQSGEEPTEIIRLNEGELTANLSYKDEVLYALSKPEQSSFYSLCSYDADENYNNFSIDIPADSLAFGLFTAQLADMDNIIVQCPYSVYVFEQRDNGIVLMDGFPFVFADSSSAPLTIQDWDSNGTLDLIIGTSTRVYIIDHKGGDMSSVSFNIAATDDGISAGAIALDLDGDEKMELASALSMNRLVMWDDNSHIESGFPTSFANRGRTLPFVAKGADDSYYLWLATDNGSIFRAALPNYDPQTADQGWLCEYGNLQRTASRGASTSQNQYESNSLFVENELYFFPNPLKSIYEPRIRLSVMPTRDAEIELAIYDISGKLVYKHKAIAYAYLRNLDIFNIPSSRLGSGIYLAVIKGGDQTKSLRFGIEK